MSTLHAPGPWRRTPLLTSVIPRVESSTLSQNIVDADGREVATVRGWWGEPDDHEGNADLIAAAPDLLDMVRVLLDAVDDLDHRGAFVAEMDAAKALLARLPRNKRDAAGERSA